MIFVHIFNDLTHLWKEGTNSNEPCRGFVVFANLLRAAWAERLSVGLPEGRDRNRSSSSSEWFSRGLPYIYVIIVTDWGKMTFIF